MIIARLCIGMIIARERILEGVWGDWESHGGGDTLQMTNPLKLVR